MLSPSIDGVSPAVIGHMSANVQVFGRWQDKPFHVLRLPASEKRQGKKSRWVGHPSVPAGAMEI